MMAGALISPVSIAPVRGWLIAGTDDACPLSVPAADLTPTSSLVRPPQSIFSSVIADWRSGRNDTAHCDTRSLPRLRQQNPHSAC
jgi:hypothetical protein